MLYCDFDRKQLAPDVNILFPKWTPGDERVVILSPHDDDALIGAGYAALASMENGAEVWIVIFSKGEAGYSRIEDKEAIVATRHAETILAYAFLGIPEARILNLGYSDFSVLEHIGWKLNDKTEGSFRTLVTLLRRTRATRVLIPNDHREHVDHSAVCAMGAFHTPQAGDPVCVDWAAPYPCRSVLQYSVWADFSPEDALVHGRNAAIRADRAVIVSADDEEKIRRGVTAYRSQGAIIAGLVAAREERKTSRGYIELYRTYDPRPKLDFKPYVRIVNELEGAR